LKARELIDSAAFGPDTLKMLGQAFDEAWAIIGGNFEENTLAVQAARLKLANAILAEAKASDDVETLKNKALQAMALAYRRRDANLQRAVPKTQAERKGIYLREH
jgi:hypothetical protein